jgi:hypothetical protein
LLEECGNSQIAAELNEKMAILERSAVSQHKLPGRADS